MTKKFILIDDDEDDRMLFCSALEDIVKDINCLSMENGFRLLETLEENQPGLPDIIFLDINMPVKNGWSLLLMLKQHDRFKAIPVIMYSTSSSEIDIEKSSQYGALFLFTKPDDFADLRNCLGIIHRNLEQGTLNELNETVCPWFHHGHVKQA